MNTQAQQWSDINANILATVQKLADINRGLMMGMMQQQMSIMNICMDGSMKQMQVLSTKDVQEAVAAETSLVKDINEKIVQNLYNTMEMLTDGKKQLTHWFEDSVKNH